MNASDMNWLLRTIEDPETARRFVVAQYRRARISYPVMAELALEWGWINLIDNEVQITPTLHSTEYATAERSMVSS